MYRTTITALAAGAILTGCTAQAATPTSVDGLADALGCANLTPVTDTLAAEEATCTLPAGQVTLIEYGTPEGAEALADVARGFGLEVKFVTDVLAIAGDRPTVKAAAEAL